MFKRSSRSECSLALYFPDLQFYIPERNVFSKFSEPLEIWVTLLQCSRMYWSCDYNIHFSAAVCSAASTKISGDSQPFSTIKKDSGAKIGLIYVHNEIRSGEKLFLFLQYLFDSDSRRAVSYFFFAFLPDKFTAERTINRQQNYCDNRYPAYISDCVHRQLSA